MVHTSRPYASVDRRQQAFNQIGLIRSAGIRDNHRRGLVADFLKAKIRDGSRLSAVSAHIRLRSPQRLP